MDKHAARIVLYMDVPPEMTEERMTESFRVITDALAELLKKKHGIQVSDATIEIFKEVPWDASRRN